MLCGPNQRGFTMIEAMVAVAIATMGIIFGISTFSRVNASNQLTSTANLLVGAVRMAQLEAIKRNVNSQFCANTTTANTTDTLGTACGTSLAAVWWIDASNNTTQLAQPPIIPSTISIGDGSSGTNAMTALRFSGSGLATSATSTSTPYTGLVADLWAPKGTTSNHRCIYMTTGSQLSVCSATGGAGACQTFEPTNASACQQ